MFFRFRLLQFRVLQIPAFTIPCFTDSGFYNSVFYRFRLLQFRVLQTPAFTIPCFRIPFSIPHSIPLFLIPGFTDSPQIYAVSMGEVYIMRVLCILFKSLLLSYYQPPSPCRNKNMEISCESPAPPARVLTN